jgi:hypothetical protein
MPKRIAIEMKCERCPAVWFEDYVPGVPEPSTPHVEISISGEGVEPKLIKYEVLCKKCVTTITNYIKSVDRDPNARKKPRAKKKGGATESATPPSTDAKQPSSNEPEHSKSSGSAPVRSSGRRLPSTPSSS